MTETRGIQEVTELTPADTAAQVTGVDRRIGRRRTDRIVAASNSAQKSLEQAIAAARSNLPVLIVGPQGSGKEHIARAVHAWSNRSEGTLVALPAGGIPDALQGRELFGSADGPGAIAIAANTSILIDGVDALSDAVRARLLQSIKTGQMTPDGQTESTPIHARVLLTAENDQSARIADLAVQRVELDPLSRRSEDILPLAAHFLAIFSEEDGVKPVGFTADARRWLVEEPWPGNVRELRERVRQAVRLAGSGAVSVEALMLANDGDEVPSFKEAKRAFETRYVEGLLRRCSGNISRAARLAKKDRKDFYDVIRRTGVNPTDFRP